MGDIIGGVTDALGLTDHAGAEAAAEAATASNNAANALAAESLTYAKEQTAFAKDQYQDWENVYGDLQKNLSDYYNSLTPEKIISQGLQLQQRAFQDSTAAINKDLMKRGISSNSGIAANINAQNVMANSGAKAAIRAGAEDQVAAQKVGFLSLGLGQGASLLSNVSQNSGNVTNAYGQGVSVNTNAFNQYLNRSTTLKTASMDTMGDIVGAAVGGSFGSAAKK